MKESTTKETSKRVFRIIKRIFIIILTPFTILGLFVFITFIQITIGITNSKTMLDLGEYNITCFSKNDIVYNGSCNICEYKRDCIQGKIRGLNRNSIIDTTYIYSPKRVRDIQEGLLNQEEIDGLYNYIIIKGGILKEYSNNTISELPIEQQEIFKDLEQNPRIIIDGKVEEWYK